MKYLPLDLSGVQPLLAGLHPHRALFDAVCTAVLLRAIADALMPRCLDLEDFLERAERVSHEPALLVRLRFGKHKGTAFAEVPDDYLEWLLREPGMDADAVFTARHHMRLRRARSLATSAAVAG